MGWIMTTLPLVWAELTTFDARPPLQSPGKAEVINSPQSRCGVQPHPHLSCNDHSQKELFGHVLHGITLLAVDTPSM